MDDPENTAVFAEIISEGNETRAELKKCVPQGSGFEAVPVEARR